MGRGLMLGLGRWALLALAAALLLAACGEGGGRAGPGDATPGGRAWVEYLETQCLTNPWEQDWLARTSRPPEAFPQGDEARLAILREYYQGRGLAIHEARRVQYLRPDQAVCLACNCPNGYKVQALIDEAAVGRALELGFGRAP